MNWNIFFFFQRPKDLQNRCNFQTVLQLVTNLQGSSARLFCNPCAACLAIPDCFLKNFSLTLRLWWVIAAMKVSNLQYFQYNTMRLETCLFTYLKEFSAPNNDADPLIFYQMSLQYLNDTLEFLAKCLKLKVNFCFELRSHQLTYDRRNLSSIGARFKVIGGYSCSEPMKSKQAKRRQSQIENNPANR